MRTATFLGKLFNVRSGEWRRLSLLYAMSLVALTGLNWGDAIVQAAFLQRVGVQYLPWVFISSAACSVGALFIYTAFADRVSNTRLLIGILAISGVGLVLGLAMLAGGLVGPAFLLLYLVLNVPLLDVYNVHWATYVNGFYDIRAAKRIVPLLGTAARLAGIIAGWSMPLLNRLLSPAAIVGVCLISLAVMAALAATLPRLLREVRPGPQAGAQDASRDRGGGTPAGLRDWAGGFVPAYGRNLRESYRQIMASPFLGWMALSTLTMTVLLALLNYQASAIFQAQLKTTAQISNFMGVLSGAANLVVLPIQLFLLSRLIARLGLGNASLVYPVTSLGSAAALAVAPTLGAAGLAYLDRTALRTAFRTPTENLLYNAVPLRVKARTRAFVGGLVVPLGTITGGLLLLTPLKNTAWFLPTAILVLGLAFPLAALLVRRHYSQALVAILDQEDFSSLSLQAPSPQAPSLVATVDPATLASLTQKLNESASPERSIFLAHVIAEIDDEAAVRIVGQAARATTDGRLAASLVDVLVAAGLRWGAAAELYAGMLAHPDGQVRLSAVAGLEQIDGPRDARYLGIAALLQVDPVIEVRLRVLPALLAADDPGCRALGTAALAALLRASDARLRARGLDVVRQTAAAGFLSEVVRSLADGADEVRLAAALAAELLAGSELPPGDMPTLLAPVLALLHDPIERARTAAVAVLGRLSQAGGTDVALARDGLIAALADASPDVRERAAEALVGAGQAAIPPLLTQVDAGDPRLRKMAAVVLARIEPRIYAPLVRGPNLDADLQAIYGNLGCLQALAGCAGPAIAVLGRALRERNAALLDDLFYLLGAIHEPAAVKTIANSLRSPQPAVRANAAEALEALTAPQTAALVAPLYEPDLPSEQILSLAERTWGISIRTPAAALRLILHEAGDAWLRTLAAAALVELSASAGPLSQPEIGELLGLVLADADAGVRAEACIGNAGSRLAVGHELQGGRSLSFVEKLILLEAVPFFQGMTIDQLKVLATVCEEEQFAEGAHIFDQGDAGGAFYVVAAGQVEIEQEKRKGSTASLAIISANSYFGESNLFDNSPRSTAAVALQDTLSLRLRREPLIDLVRRQPDVSLELINALAQRLREAGDQIADLARSRPRELHKLFDSLEDVASA